MVEPLSVLAGAVATYILPKALEKVGEKVGEAALEKSGESIRAVRHLVKEKLQATGTIGLMQRAEESPTELNVQVLQAELVNQMEGDNAFTRHLQRLVEQIQSQSPSLQVILDGLKVTGKVDIGNVKQSSKGTASKQLMGRDWEIKGDVKIGDITQESGGSN